MSSEAVTLGIARQVVIGKLYNQRELLSRRMAGAASPLQIQRSTNSIGQMLKQAGQTPSLDSLRGYEGKAGADYWAAFRVLLPNDFGFQGRKYYPPPDPINSLLSFGYSLLLKDVTAAVQLVGLDPYLGFFHTIDYGRPSLALDMMEEFRPVLVDWIVLDIVKQGQLTAADYEQTGQPKQPVRLKERLMDVLIEQYERRATEKVNHPDGGGQTAYRRVIELQVRRLARLMLDQARSYEPFLLKSE
jgi:CRISPR-associated protein Cas1